MAATLARRASGVAAGEGTLMSRQSAAGVDGPPEVIYIIRHGEKPDPGPPHGVDFHGRKDEHSLLPRGWQRSGALTALFGPASGPRRGPPGTGPARPSRASPTSWN